MSSSPSASPTSTPPSTSTRASSTPSRPSAVPATPTSPSPSRRSSSCCSRARPARRPAWTTSVSRCPPTDEVTAATARLAEAGLATRVEDNTTCCYAVQDKVWVTGPGGEPWEVYTVTGDARPDLEGQTDLELSAVAGDGTCCTEGSDTDARVARRLLLTLVRRRGKVARVDLDEVADELYAVPPEEFIALRTARQDEAKADGDKALAKEIGALPKPSAAAWVGQPAGARRSGPRSRDWSSSASLLREAQENLAGDQLKALDTQRAQLVNAADPAGLRARPRARPADQHVGRRPGRGDPAGRHGRPRGGRGAAHRPAHLADVLQRHGDDGRAARPPPGAPAEAGAAPPSSRTAAAASSGRLGRRPQPGARAGAGGGAPGGRGEAPAGAGARRRRPPTRPTALRRRGAGRRRGASGSRPRSSTPAERSCRPASPSSPTSSPQPSGEAAEAAAAAQAGRAAAAEPPSARRPRRPTPGTARAARVEQLSSRPTATDRAGPCPRARPGRHSCATDPPSRRRGGHRERTPGTGDRGHLRRPLAQRRRTSPRRSRSPSAGSSVQEVHDRRHREQARRGPRRADRRRPGDDRGPGRARRGRTGREPVVGPDAGRADVGRRPVGSRAPASPTASPPVRNRRRTRPR